MKRAAFTLVELVVVILILGILAGVAAPRFVDTSREATDASVRQTLAIVRDAIELFAAQTGALPTHNGNADGAGSLADNLQPYLRGGIPASPVGALNNGVGLVNEPTDDNVVGAAAPLNGWIYNPLTGTFINGFSGQTAAGDGTTYDQF